MAESKFEWDGEKIKATTAAVEKKHTPKDLFEALERDRAELEKALEQKEQNAMQLKIIEGNIKKSKEHIAQLEEFEDKCNEILLGKLELYIEQITAEYKEKAQKMADETIAKDPDAYLPEQVKQMPYLNFQKLLATNEEIAEKIPADLIKKHLYDEPIFDNPFGGEDK